MDAELLAQAFDGVTEGVTVLDRQLRYVYVNPAAEQLLQHPAAEVIGRQALDLFPEAAASTFLAPFETALQTGQPTVHEGYAATRDQWFEQRCYPFSGGLTIFFRDVTDRKRAEQALAASEGRFRTLADTAPVLIWMADRAQGYYFFNQPWLAFTGRTHEEEAGTGWTEGIHPEDRERHREAYTRAFEVREPFEVEYRLRRHDGAYRWVLDRGAPQHDAAGVFVGYIGSCIDIHERWSAEHQMEYLAEASRLLSSSLDYETVLQQIAKLVVPTLADWAGVDIVTDDGRAQRVAIAHVNPEMVALVEELDRKYPVDLDAPTGLGHIVRTGESLLLPDIPQEMVVAGARDEAHREILLTLGMTSAISVPLRTRTRILGAISLVASHGSRRYDEADLRFVQELAARAGIAADNAVLYRQAREAEAALREVNEALEARVEARTAELARSNHELAVRNRELQDFAYVASHDLQEPLRKVQSFANLLTSEHAHTLDPEGQHYVARIQAAAQRMSSLIRDLLAFSRVATAQQPVQRVDLNETLTAVRSDLEVRLAETGGRIEAPTALPVVEADPVQMHQLLLNLVGNALKFRREGVPPTVRVWAERAATPGTICLVVEDNGIGFEQKHAERIFTPFQRLHARHEYEGTGMGLAIVRRIAERHHGSVTAQSTPGQGTRFTIVLPDAA